MFKKKTYRGYFLRIVVGITVLALMLAGDASAEFTIDPSNDIRIQEFFIGGK